MTHELWARLILTLGAAVVVPLAIRYGMRIADRRVMVVCLAAAGLLGIAEVLPQGIQAATIAAPWFLVTCVIAMAGLADAWKFRRGPFSRLACACGMIYLAIGGGWVLVERAGMRPLGFDPAIVLLTGIHFHYAGFALPILAGLAIGNDSPRDCGFLERGIAIGVIASVPLVAVGITASHLGATPLLEGIAAWCMSLSGLGVSWLYLRLAFEPTTNSVSRQLWSLAALFLAAGMCLSILYGSRWLVPLPWLDIPAMRAWHGTANALGFTIPALVGWRWQRSAPSNRPWQRS